MQITFKDGSKHNIETKLNIKKLMKINKDFNTDRLVTITFDSKGQQSFNLLVGLEAVYVAYRQANMNDYLSFGDFTDQWEFDLPFSMNVYAEMMNAKAKSDNNGFKKSFKSKN